MTLISALSIRNFQSHRKLDIDLDPGVTTIIGPSDVGKSAILRAIKWVASNQPSGDAFVRKGKTSASVTVWLISQDEKQTTRITRSRGGKGGNLYLIEGKPYKAFGSAPPDDVIRLMNVQDLNFQGQYDSPFWLSESAGEVSRQLNRIVALDVIDTAQSKLAGKSRRAKAEIDVLLDRVSQARKEKKRWALAPKLLDEVKQLDQVARSIVDKQSALDSFAQQINAAAARKMGIRCRSSEMQLLDRLVGLGRHWEHLSARTQALQGAIQAAERAATTAGREPPDPSPLVALEARSADLQIRTTALSDDVNVAAKSFRGLRRLRRKLKEAEAEFKRKVGKRCPLCGSAVRK